MTAAWLRAGALAVLIVLAAAAPDRADASNPLFARDTLDLSITNPTSLAFGPDGRLYVASLSQIRAVTLDPSSKEVLAVETVASGLQGVLGIAFDPTAPSSPVVVYASRQEPGATDAYEGVISTFTAPGWTRAEVITGLPSSTPYFNHVTNGIAFDGDGQLFIAQGSNTDAGLSGPYWPETPLSAAILLAGVNDPGFDGAITYSPSGPPADDNVDQAGGDVSVFAPGFRNPYDLVVHSNGYVYATDNGPLGGSVSLTCSTSGGTSSTSDSLDLVEAGNYYGHPNRNRGRSDARQCTYHAPQEGSGAGFTGPIATLPSHCSCDGIAEYTSGALGGKLEGDLVYVEFIPGNVSRAELSADGRSVLATSVLDSGFDQPLDVTVGPDGTIYVAEYGGDRVSYLAPLAVGGVAAAPDVAGGAGTGGRSLAAITLAAAGALAALLATARLRPQHRPPEED